jgi:MoxR-like ATPase
MSEANQTMTAQPAQTVEAVAPAEPTGAAETGTAAAAAAAAMPEQHRSQLAGLRAALNRAIRGKPEVIERVLACLLARGHLLLEDLPGLGKTTLAKALAAAIGGRFARVQCTPDLLPGDITGFSVFNQKTREFEFLPGPVFADVLLADEINRTTPRTQSALLEAMAERQVTVDNVQHTLSPTFFVIATQNPVEHHGTYPLPEAQLDRFAMKLSIGYPQRTDELELLARAVGEVDGEPLPSAILPEGGLGRLQAQVARVAVAENVRAYLVDLARATRAHPKVTLGLSPRGLLIWQRVAQAWAYLHERPFVTPDDVQETAHAVLSVRLGLAPDATAAVLTSVIESVAVPT